MRFSLITIIIFSVGVLLGVVAMGQLDIFQEQESQEVILPIPYQTLTNPIIEQFHANAKGIVVAKSDATLTLEQDGQKLKIFLAEESGLTIFEEETDEGRNTIDFASIEIGDYLEGGVVIVIDSFLEGMDIIEPRPLGNIIALSFTVFHKEDAP